MIIADEPISALDASAQAQIANLLVSLARDLNLGVLFISHDLAIVRHVADLVTVMYLGKVVESSPTARLWERPSTLHEGADRVGAPARRVGRAAARAPGRDTRPGEPAARLPLPPALRLRLRPLSTRGARLARDRTGPPRRVLAARAGSSRRRGCEGDTVTLLDPRPLGPLLTTLAGAGAGAAGTLSRPALVAELEHESAAAFDVALELEATAYELGAEGQSVRSPWRFAVSGPGQALGELHGSREAIELASAIAGEPMAPTKSSLYFRDEADFIGFHTDVPGCEVVLLLGVTAERAELVLHPELARAEPPSCSSSAGDRAASRAAAGRCRSRRAPSSLRRAPGPAPDAAGAGSGPSFRRACATPGGHGESPRSATRSRPARRAGIRARRCARESRHPIRGASGPSGPNGPRPA